MATADDKSVLRFFIKLLTMNITNGGGLPSDLLENFYVELSQSKEEINSVGKKSMKFGRTEREEYAKEHKVKKNTIDKALTALLENSLIEKVGVATFELGEPFEGYSLTKEEGEYVMRIPIPKQK